MNNYKILNAPENTGLLQVLRTIASLNVIQSSWVSITSSRSWKGGNCLRLSITNRSHQKLVAWNSDCFFFFSFPPLVQVPRPKLVHDTDHRVQVGGTTNGVSIAEGVVLWGSLKEPPATVSSKSHYLLTYYHVPVNYFNHTIALQRRFDLLHFSDRKIEVRMFWLTCRRSQISK